MRTSIVDYLKINSVLFASVVQIGDSENINANSKALALQRQNARFGDLDLDYSQYKVFQATIPVPLCTNEVQTSMVSQNGVIHVGKLRILGISVAGVLHIGTTGDITLQSRVKHIRNFLKNPYKK